MKAMYFSEQNRFALILSREEMSVIAAAIGNTNGKMNIEQTKELIRIFPEGGFVTVTSRICDGMFSKMLEVSSSQVTHEVGEV